MRTELVILGLLWVTYCAIHSLFISDFMKRRAESLLKGSFTYYRLFYNMLSVMLLIPVVLYEKSIVPVPLFGYRGWMRVLQISVLTGSISLFTLGARAYDMGHFLGLKQVKNNGYRERETFSTSGVLGFVRHPWYLAGMMIIWGRDIDDRTLMTNLVLSAYFIVGSFLEETRLKKKFGQRYLDYMADVSMLIPVKWTIKRLSRGTHR